jgi:hypothetical protein
MKKVGLDPDQDLSRPHLLAVLHHLLDARIRIDGANGLVREQQAADDAAALGVDLPGLDRVLADQKSAGRITRTDLVPERLLDIGPYHEAIELHVRAP